MTTDVTGTPLENRTINSELVTLVRQTRNSGALTCFGDLILQVLHRLLAGHGNSEDNDEETGD